MGILMYLGVQQPTAAYLLKQHQKHVKSKAKKRFKEVLESIKLYGKAVVYLPDPQLQHLIGLIDDSGLQYDLHPYATDETKVTVHF